MKKVKDTILIHRLTPFLQSLKIIMFVCKYLLFILGIKTVIAANSQGFVEVHKMKLVSN